MPEAPQPSTVDVAGRRLVRVGISTGPMRFSEIGPDDAVLPGGGNRYDVLGGGVLYAADSEQTAFLELLRGMRPNARSLAHPEEGMPGAELVRRSWRARRQVVEFELIDPAPFLDLRHPATHAALTRELAPGLAARGIDRVDLAVTLSPDRTLTRLFSQWAYVQRGVRGPMYGGIAYASRTDARTCFAVFDTQLHSEPVARTIAADDRALLGAAEHYGLEIE